MEDRGSTLLGVPGPWINDHPIGPEEARYKCGGNDRLRTLMGSTWKAPVIP